MPRYDSTRWTVVLGAASHDPKHEELFCACYGPVLRAYFAARWRLPADHEMVADATQDVFLQCFKPDGALQAASSDAVDHFRPFLYGVAKNVALMTERRLARRDARLKQSDIELDNIQQDEATLSQVFDRSWAQAVAVQAHDLMISHATAGDSRAAVEVLQLRYDDGLPPREIATRLDRDVEAVYGLLKRGKRLFRSALLEVMATHYPGVSQNELEKRCQDFLPLMM